MKTLSLFLQYKNAALALAVFSIGLFSFDAFAQTSDDFFASITNQLEAEKEGEAPRGDLGLENPGFGLPVDNSVLAEQDRMILNEREALQRAIREQAFQAAITGLFPLNTDEIRSLLRRYDETQQAVETPIYPQPTPEIVTHTVALDPGTEPPIIKVATGHVALLTFLDSTGAPWPIGTVSWAGNFELIQSEEGGNIITITPMSEFANGNMAVQLLGLVPPVLFQIQTARDSVHYRFDARIPQPGPFAKVPLIQNNSLDISSGNGMIGSILEGVAPREALKLTVAGVDGRTSAYKLGSQTFLRTPLTLLSPGWTSSVSSADGMNVYALRNAPVVLLSDNGHVRRARLTEGVNLDDE